jgi:hypothetical protein
MKPGTPGPMPLTSIRHIGQTVLFVMELRVLLCNNELVFPGPVAWGPLRRGHAWRR